MVFLDLHQSAHIVDEVCQCDVGFCPYQSHSSEYQAAHRLLHESEDMFHTAAHLRLPSVALLLLLRQRMAYQDNELKRTVEEDEIRFDVTLYGANYYEKDGPDEYINEIIDWEDVFRLPKMGVIKIYDNEKSEHPLF